MAPPVPNRPTVTNIGAQKVDLVWEPPGDSFENMFVTGYKILWFQPGFRSRVNNMTVGNITTTSVRGLQVMQRTRIWLDYVILYEYLIVIACDRVCVCDRRNRRGSLPRESGIASDRFIRPQKPR